MTSINTSTWKEFVIGKLFSNIVTPHVYHTREVKEKDDGIPYVVRTKFNNGIKYRVDGSSLVLNPKGVISFGAENSHFFYQEEEYVSGRDMYYIDTRKYSKNVCLFFASCLNTLTSKYSYNFGLFPKLIKQEKILLPVRDNGELDLEYMEQYIEDVIEKSQKKLKEIFEGDRDVQLIDISKWKKFRLIDLFEITGSTTTPKKDLQLDEKEKYPYVTTAATNNGITGFSNKFTEEGNVLTVDSAVIGTCFYQEEKFTASDHVEKLIPKFPMSRNVGLFLATIINSSGKQLNYAYNEKRSQTALRKEEILLPVDSNEKPDWNYMEEYITNKILTLKEKLKSLNIE